mmetsp:Transcript_17361/g.32652  ORF Transcript_17361/g.32652 Transcript_17361/m.32652 type:complete len:211 (-) Transcript_17361:439-1071(-)
MLCTTTPTLCEWGRSRRSTMNVSVSRRQKRVGKARSIFIITSSTSNALSLQGVSRKSPDQRQTKLQAMDQSHLMYTSLSVLPAHLPEIRLLEWYLVWSAGLVPSRRQAWLPLRRHRLDIMMAGTPMWSHRGDRSVQTRTGHRSNRSSTSSGRTVKFWIHRQLRSKSDKSSTLKRRLTWTKPLSHRWSPGTMSGVSRHLMLGANVPCSTSS